MIRSSFLTSYFQRTIDDEAEEEDEKSAVAEVESILDIALSRYQPVRRLRWHYRSQHHSLIAFSNSEFYDDQLEPVMNFIPGVD